MHFDRVQAQQIGHDLHAIGRNVVVSPLDLLEDGQQPAPLAAILLAQLDKLLAEPITLGHQHGVSPQPTCETRQASPHHRRLRATVATARHIRSGRKGKPRAA